MMGFRFPRVLARFHFIPVLLVLSDPWAASAAASEFRIVPEKSRVEFRIGFLALGTVEGRFESFSGRFQMNGSGTALQSLESSIDTRSINTGIGFRDDQLRGESFLQADRFPELLFSSKKCDSTDSGTKVTGTLTVGGSPKPVVFYAGIPKIETDAKGKKLAVVTGHAVLKRAETGLKFGDSRDRDEKWLSDEVRVEVSLVGQEL
jgi:polyisoprenoid-binding protein YceI